MMFGALQITSAVLLLIGTLLLAISLVSHFWSFYHVQIGYNTGGDAGVRHINKTGHRGLWELCHDAHAEPIEGYHACINRYTDFNKAGRNNQLSTFVGSMNLNYESWDLACLVMMILAVAFGVIALFISPMCCHSRLRLAHGFLVLFAALNGLMCVIVYAAMAMKSSMSQETTWQKFDKFGYSFVVAIIGSLVSLLSAVLFLVASCVGQHHHYERAPKA